MNAVHGAKRDRYFQEIEKMDRSQAEKEWESLRKAIEYHNDLYYRKHQRQIADPVYDRLNNRLRELESAFPEIRNRFEWNT